MATTKLVQLGPSAQVAAGGSGAPNAIDPNDVIVELGGSLNSIRQELADAWADMGTLVNREPDEIMRMCGGHAARIAELRKNALAVDEWRIARDLRVREIEPCLEELRWQWSNGSRLHSTRELDWRIESGER